MRIIMYTIVLISFVDNNSKQQQKRYVAKELGTDNKLVYICPDTTEVNIGDTLMFPMEVDNKN